MESNRASEHLKVIRTLMERCAVYRRALGPVLLFNGAAGLLGALAGYYFRLTSPSLFIRYWCAVAVAAMAGSYLLVRRQALRDAEPFWSPPTRRVTLAMLPPLAAGAIVTILVYNAVRNDPIESTAHGRVLGLFWLPIIWVLFYACAFNAAGFFMPRGMKLFGWILLAGAAVCLLVGLPDQVDSNVYCYGIMGVFFGLLQLAYGLYIQFGEKSSPEAVP